jgi:acetyltransferase-like isoleucine patch superfamily enzyme
MTMHAAACVALFAPVAKSRVERARPSQGRAPRRHPARVAATADAGGGGISEGGNAESTTTSTIDYEPQKRHRMSWMHWLHDIPKHAAWARAWQRHVQATLSALETVRFGEECFVAENVHIFAEPGRDVAVGDGTHIGADVFVHGPVTFGKNVALNARCHIDGGRAGVVIGDDTRIGPECRLFAFNHSFAPDALVREQPTTSEGIVVGRDVWLGASVCVTDGVRIGDHAVVGMGAVVTKDVPEWAVAAGNPARVVGDRRTWKTRTKSS